MYVYSHPGMVKSPIVIWKDFIGNKITRPVLYMLQCTLEWHVMFDTMVTHITAFDQQSDLVLQYSQMEMFKATVCVCVSTHMIESMWAWVDVLYSVFGGLAVAPALGDPCWWRPAGPTSAHCWRQKWGKAFCLLSAPLIFHLIRSLHHFSLPSLLITAIVSLLYKLPSCSIFSPKSSQTFIIWDLSGAKLPPKADGVQIWHCEKQWFVINVSKFSLDVKNILESVDSQSLFSERAFWIKSISSPRCGCWVRNM